MSDTIDERTSAYKIAVDARERQRKIVRYYRGAMLRRDGRCCRCLQRLRPCPSCGTPQCWCTGIDKIRRHWQDDGTPYAFYYERKAIEDAMRVR